MNIRKNWRTAAISVALACAATASWAHEGHDDAPAAPAGEALPRFVAASDDFELVGVLHGQRLALYLDHAPDNRPVAKGELDLEIDGKTVKVQPHGEGEFEVELAEALPDGETPIMATVTVGDQVDLLAGALDIHVDDHAQDGASRVLSAPYAWGGGALVGAGLLLWGLRRRSASERSAA